MLDSHRLPSCGNGRRPDQASRAVFSSFNKHWAAPKRCTRALLGMKDALSDSDGRRHAFQSPKKNPNVSRE